MWIFRQLFSEVIVLVCFSLEAIEAKLGWYKSALLSKKKSLGEICDHKSLYNTLSGHFRSHVWIFFFFLHAPFNSSAVLNSFLKLVTNLVRTLGLERNITTDTSSQMLLTCRCYRLFSRELLPRQGQKKCQTLRAVSETSVRTVITDKRTSWPACRSWLQTNAWTDLPRPVGSHSLINCRQDCWIWLLSPSFFKSLFVS